MVTLRVVGPITVVSDDYPLPNTTGYETAVVFKVKNPTSTPIYEARYRVQVSGPSGVLAVSDGSDTLSVGAGEIRPVVFEPDNVHGERPRGAKVTFYPVLAQTANAPPLSSQSGWTATDKRLPCQDGVYNCTGDGDLTWHGKDAQLPSRVIVVVHDTNLRGPIVAAGVQDLDMGRVVPGQVFPFSVPVVGLSQNRGVTRFKGEVYVESVADRTGSGNCPPGQVPVGETGACAPSG